MNHAQLFSFLELMIPLVIISHLVILCIFYHKLSFIKDRLLLIITLIHIVLVIAFINFWLIGEQLLINNWQLISVFIVITIIPYLLLLVAYISEFSVKLAKKYSQDQASESYGKTRKNNSYKRF